MMKRFLRLLSGQWKVALALSGVFLLSALVFWALGQAGGTLVQVQVQNLELVTPNGKVPIPSQEDQTVASTSTSGIILLVVLGVVAWLFWRKFNPRSANPTATRVGVWSRFWNNYGTPSNLLTALGVGVIIWGTFFVLPKGDLLREVADATGKTWLFASILMISLLFSQGQRKLAWVILGLLAYISVTNLKWQGMGGVFSQIDLPSLPEWLGAAIVAGALFGSLGWWLGNHKVGVVVFLIAFGLIYMSQSGKGRGQSTNWQSQARAATEARNRTNTEELVLRPGVRSKYYYHPTFKTCDTRHQGWVKYWELDGRPIKNPRTGQNVFSPTEMKPNGSRYGFIAEPAGQERVRVVMVYRFF